ncbi:MAG: hypothetical protein OXI91_10810 [Chloroflexota bacterium]|nr:hypothetical protein [Chloroflexota bacterium]
MDVATGCTRRNDDGEPADQTGEAGSDIQAGRVRLFFGSKLLWRKQHALGHNGYTCHEKWLMDWRSAGNDGFFVLGSKYETDGSGNHVHAFSVSLVTYGRPDTRLKPWSAMPWLA